MKHAKLFLTITGIICYLLNTSHSFEAKAQTIAPYSLSPKWVFGSKAMFDFTGGSAPTQPARPVGDNIIANEGSSTLCDQSKNVMVYDNNVRVGGNNNVPLGTAMGGSSSSTQGGIIIPNPSNIATQFFLITGNAEATYPSQETNDVAKAGIKVYSGSQSGLTVTAPALVSTLETDPNVREYLYSSSDGNYGYWILSSKVQVSGSTNFYAWPIPASGTLGSKTTSIFSANNIWNEQYQGSIKINRCQTKIALAQGTSIQVHNWNRTTGQIGSLIKFFDAVAVGGGSKLYGCEFSANGNYLYASTLGSSNIAVVDLTLAGTGTGLSYLTATASGTLQIGPNDVIYVANGLDGSTNGVIGTITNANTGGTYTASGVTLANSSTVRLGIANIPWLNPQKPTITAVNNSCGNYTFTPAFKTHFNDVIGITQSVWDFGDGTATVTNTGANAYDPVTHAFASTGSKTVTLTITDATCSQTWSKTLSQSIPCILPVELISFSGEKLNNNILLSWSTAQEINNQFFEIQRSEDGINFNSIGTVKGNGNSSAILNYSFNDFNPSMGENYYRLVQHDYDGKTQTSEIISIKISGIHINVFPNPSTENFNIKISGTDNAHVIISDVYGREIYSEYLSGTGLEFSFGENLPNGSYIVEVISDNQVETKKVIKQ